MRVTALPGSSRAGRADRRPGTGSVYGRRFMFRMFLLILVGVFFIRFLVEIQRSRPEGASSAHEPATPSPPPPLPSLSPKRPAMVLDTDPPTRRVARRTPTPPENPVSVQPQKITYPQERVLAMEAPSLRRGSAKDVLPPFRGRKDDVEAPFESLTSSAAGHTRQEKKSSTPEESSRFVKARQRVAPAPTEDLMANKDLVGTQKWERSASQFHADEFSFTLHRETLAFNNDMAMPNEFEQDRRLVNSLLGTRKRRKDDDGIPVPHRYLLSCSHFTEDDLPKVMQPSYRCDPVSMAVYRSVGSAMITLVEPAVAIHQATFPSKSSSSAVPDPEAKATPGIARFLSSRRRAFVELLMGSLAVVERDVRAGSHLPLPSVNGGYFLKAISEFSRGSDDAPVPVWAPELLKHHMWVDRNALQIASLLRDFNSTGSGESRLTNHDSDEQPCTSCTTETFRSTWLPRLKVASASQLQPAPSYPVELFCLRFLSVDLKIEAFKTAKDVERWVRAESDTPRAAAEKAFGSLLELDRVVKALHGDHMKKDSEGNKKGTFHSAEADGCLAHGVAAVVIVPDSLPDKTPVPKVFIRRARMVLEALLLGESEVEEGSVDLPPDPDFVQVGRGIVQVRELVVPLAKLTAAQETRSKLVKGDSLEESDDDDMKAFRNTLGAASYENQILPTALSALNNRLMTWRKKAFEAGSWMTSLFDPSERRTGNAGDPTIPMLRRRSVYVAVVPPHATFFPRNALEHLEASPEVFALSEQALAPVVFAAEGPSPGRTNGGTGGIRSDWAEAAIRREPRAASVTIPTVIANIRAANTILRFVQTSRVSSPSQGDSTRLLRRTFERGSNAKVASPGNGNPPVTSVYESWLRHVGFGAPYRLRNSQCPEVPLMVNAASMTQERKQLIGENGILAGTCATEWHAITVEGISGELLPAL